jgi:nicotinamidase-related amidase
MMLPLGRPTVGSAMIGQRALLVVDVQRGFEDPALGPRDNPHAEENVAKLIAAWRRRGDPIVVVQHDWRVDRSSAARPASS